MLNERFVHKARNPVHTSFTFIYINRDGAFYVFLNLCQTVGEVGVVIVSFESSTEASPR